MSVNRSRFYFIISLGSLILVAYYLGSWVVDSGKVVMDEAKEMIDSGLKNAVLLSEDIKKEMGFLKEVKQSFLELKSKSHQIDARFNKLEILLESLNEKLRKD